MVLIRISGLVAIAALAGCSALLAATGDEDVSVVRRGASRSGIEHDRNNRVTSRRLERVVRKKSASAAPTRTLTLEQQWRRAKRSR